MGILAGTGAPFWLVSAVAALAYGLVLQFRPVSLFRTLVKTLGVAVLALLAFLSGAPVLLVAGLCLSALGDAFLAGDPRRMLPFGLASFLAAQLVYAAFFLEIGGVGAVAHAPWRAAGFLVALGLSGGLLAFLWKDLGALRPAVIAYSLAISAMVGAAFTLPPQHAAATVGAVLFMASDGVLSVRLFRIGERPHALADHAVWWLYILGQMGIAYAFLV